jgi:hypothetical protein
MKGSLPELDLAIDRAIESLHIDWRVRIHRCAGEGNYVAVSTASAEDGEFGLPAVGTLTPEGAEVLYGHGSAIPISSFFDIEADTRAPIWLDGYLVVGSGNVGADGLDLFLGYGLPESEVPEALAEALARTANAIVAADPGCPEACEDTVAILIVEGGVDADGDGIVTPEEVISHSTPQFFMEPELDLETGDGDDAIFFPGLDCRRDRDHVAIALFIEATRLP